MFYFDTNKPQSFFTCRIPFVLESRIAWSARSYSPNISHIKDCTALKLGEAFCIFTFFYFQFLDFMYCMNGSDFYFEGVTEWKAAIECRMCIVTQESKDLRSWSCIEMCIIFKEGWKLLSIKPHLSATFSLASYPKPWSKKPIILLHPNHPFLCCNGQGTS